MSWFSRCSWYGGPFNGGNYRHCTDVSFEDEAIYDSNPNSYNQTLDFSNHPLHHNYEIDSRSDTGAAFQAEFAKFQQNFERFMAQLRCSNYGGLFNGGNCLSCSIVRSGNEFVHDPNPLPYDNTPDFSYQPPQHHIDTYFFDQPPQYSIDHQPQSILEDLNQQRMNDVYNIWIESRNELLNTERTIPLNGIISQIPPSIVITTSPPVLPTEDLEDSLIMRNEDLNIIPKKESDEFIKSSVEELVPILSKFEDTSGSDSECILPSCDDFSPIDIPEEKTVTFSNPLFNSNDDFISSGDESLSDEDVSEDNVKIYSNPLFEFDDEYISSDENPLFDEVLENIESKDSYDSNLDEPDLLVTPLSDANKDECFGSGGDVDKINDFEDGYYDSKGDILYLKNFLNC
nr:hypothetical protein [Tanacetum cinerariifolium]